ncbi:MAG: flagellar hook-length control protein FliK [Thermodesulfovibrionales bacterium]|nr:flagellar hook-length control protein FliK [Thermodesulfovibrionales bacterium]
MNSINSINSNLISIIHSSNKAISFNLGDIIKGQILDILPSNKVLIKVKDNIFTATSQISLQKGKVALFKVITLASEHSNIKLQFLTYEKLIPNLKEKHALDNEDVIILRKLINQLSKVINQYLKTDNLKDEINGKILSINREILKAFPSDINSIPQEIRIQLQNLIHKKLQSAEQGISQSLYDLVQQIPDGIEELDYLKNALFLNMDRLKHNYLKNTILNTGILYETKLKLIANLLTKISQIQNQQQTLSEPEKLREIIKNSSNQETLLFLEKNLVNIKKDIKPILLKLKNLLSDTAKAEYALSLIHKTSDDLRDELIKKINFLIKDIELYQTLSKITESFYTFLPLTWQNLKHSELHFSKSKKTTKNPSYSCKINLQLEGIGRVSTLISMSNYEFAVFFKTENNTFLSLLNTNSAELYNAFTVAGLKLKSVNFLDAEQTIEQIEQIQDKGIIDIKA